MKVRIYHRQISYGSQKHKQTACDRDGLDSHSPYPQMSIAVRSVRRPQRSLPKARIKQECWTHIVRIPHFRSMPLSSLSHDRWPVSNMNAVSVDAICLLNME